MVERVASFIERRRRWLFAVWLLHATLIHYFVLGFVSWDGLSYRVPPMVELAQHGSFGFEKYDTWIYNAYFPLIEFIHLPFLMVFKMPGVLLGFPLVAFPLCVLAIFALCREITTDERAATLGALAWLAVPTMNTQPYTGYIDFAVCGLLAFTLFTVIRVRRAGRNLRSFVLIVVATAVFTLSRQQGMYILGLLFPFIGYAVFCEREGFRIRIPRWREGLFTIGSLFVGALPALSYQTWKYFHYGSPTYPYQFQALGIKIGTGTPISSTFADGGLRELTASAFARAAMGAWIWPKAWPVGSFADSRNMGGGFLFILVLAVLALFLKWASRLERWLLLAFVLVSLIARDFWLPRYAYTLILVIALVLGRVLAEATRRERWKPLFVGGLAFLLVHLGRPEFDVSALPELGPRLDVANTTHIFHREAGAIQPFPDMNAHFVIIGVISNGFALPVFGRRLTNEVLHSIRPTDIGDHCSGIPVADRNPSYLFIDDSDATKDCARECVLQDDRCLAYRLRWDEPAAAP
jgi:hypothetical protein